MVWFVMCTGPKASYRAVQYKDMYCYTAGNKSEIFSDVNWWHHWSYQCDVSSKEWLNEVKHIYVSCFKVKLCPLPERTLATLQVMTSFPCRGITAWINVLSLEAVRGHTGQRGPGDRGGEGAASCLTESWTDYSLIAVDVKADEVITRPARCGRARPCDKVNPPCVRGGGWCL